MMKIITLCGSLKYQKQLMEIAENLAIDGWCVLTPVWSVSNRRIDAHTTENFKRAHLKRIDMSDAVFIANIDGYIGDSTREELEYAKSKGKHVVFYMNS